MDEARDDQVRAIALRLQSDGHPGFAGSPTPRLIWRLDADRPNVRQKAYQFEIAEDPGFTTAITQPPPVEASLISAPWPAAPLTSREIRFVRVRVLTDRGVTAWSEALRVEAALFMSDDWTARPISPISNVEQTHPAAVPLLRRSFMIDQPVAQARLYISALGVHDSWLNGVAVGDAFLDPGWTAYRSKLHYAVHDVSEMLCPGENVLAAAVGDGWWRGWLTWMGRRAIYGDTTALLAQLEIAFVDGTTLTVASDESWHGATGALLSADLYDGCEVDLRAEPNGWRLPGFADAGWENVSALDLPTGLTLRAMPPVRIVDRFEVAAVSRGAGRWMVDTGQNLAGFLRLDVRGPVGASVTVRHAEMLDRAEDLYTAPLRGAKATDRYTLADASIVSLQPSFTFHGFQYAEIVVDPGVEILAVEACALSSDLARTGSFTCSDARLNTLFDNVRWSQIGNFLSVPTDCPQRDERLGWTGDIQVFAQTACANADAASFLGSWLGDLATEQRADGNVPCTVPNVLYDFKYEYGGAGWGDAATLVPWALYEAYGDATVLSDQFESMRRWVDYGASRRGADGTWSGDFQLGDWLDPGADPATPHKATTNGDFIATAYLAHSARTVARAADVLGHVTLADHYRNLGDTAAHAAWTRWRDHAVTTQAGCAIALCFDIAPAEDRPRIVRALAALVEAGDGRIATGFLGTPLVLPALTAGDEIDTAYRLLLNEHCPGWLYQVACGATTMWERWDAVGDDGALHEGAMAISADTSMISFNHYAYGAVAAWLYRSVAGIAPDASDPGYGLIRFAPQPDGGLNHARAELDTPYGKAAIAWRLDDTTLAVDLLIPPGARATFTVPNGWSGDNGDLGSGKHRKTFRRTL